MASDPPTTYDRPVALFQRKRSWPHVPHEEVVRRSRILVLDDRDFPYLKLFDRDGYTVKHWHNVEDLPKLETEFDLILLDLHGVGLDESANEGPGLLEHLRKVNPTLLVVAYSNADWSLDYQRYFALADASLHKTKADYVEFKRTVDELLDRKFSLGFYLDRIVAELEKAGIGAEVRSRAEKAILRGRPASMRGYLIERGADAITVERVIGIAQVAVGIIALF